MDNIQAGVLVVLDLFKSLLQVLKLKCACAQSLTCEVIYNYLGFLILDLVLDLSCEVFIIKEEAINIYLFLKLELLVQFLHIALYEVNQSALNREEHLFLCCI